MTGEDIILYSEFVESKSKRGNEIIEDLTPEKAELLHMAVGVCGEAGELLDAIKKHCIYTKPLDYRNIVEELGDIEFHMQGIRNLVGIDRLDCISENIKKLNTRYKEGYSNNQAIERQDKRIDAWREL